MKKEFPPKSFRILAVIVLLFVIHGCKKDILEPEVARAIYPDPAIENMPLYTGPGFSETYPEKPLLDDRAFPPSFYLSFPAINAWLPAPTSSVVYGSKTYYGGPFQASISSISGSTISIKVKRTDGYYFPLNSVLSIISTSTGLPVASVPLTSSTLSTYTLTFTETVMWGSSTSSNYNGNVKQYVAAWFNPVSQMNFYSSSFSSSAATGTAIRIIAMPVGWGNSLGSLDNVPLYSNGYGNFLGTTYTTDSYGEKYQCVNFIRRYYSIAKGKNIVGNGGNADSYWFSNSSHNLPTKKVNGASGNGVPQHGDVMCFQKNGFYHVGIVYGPVGNCIRVFHQNVGITYNSTYSTYCYPYMDFPFTNSSGTYTLNGSPLGSGWTVVGWLR